MKNNSPDDNGMHSENGYNIRRDSLTPRQKRLILQRRRKRRISKRIGIVLSCIEIVLFVLAMITVYRLGVIPGKYFIAAGLIIGVISFFALMSQFAKHKLPGKIIAVVLAFMCGFVMFYANVTMDALSSITGANTESYQYSVVVAAEDSAESMTDVADYTFEYVSGMDSSNLDKLMTMIAKDTKTEPASKEASDWQTVIGDLSTGSGIAIIVPESIRDSISSIMTTFSTDTKVLKTYTIQETVPESNTSSSKVNVSMEPFALYIAGNDQEGEIGTTGNNDVNLVVVVNPKTRQILIVSTPRDSYIPIVTDTGTVMEKDKLTHAGDYGVGYSMATLEHLYDVSLDYYFRLNFTGCAGIVDAIAPITVHSDVDFTTTPDTYPEPLTFYAGDNVIDNGDYALAFCRERHAFPLGDIQRGKDQMYVLTGIIDRVSSPAILTRYTSLMESIKDLFNTNMPQSNFTKLVNMTLQDSTWNVQTYSTMYDSFTTEYSPLLTFNVDMTILDETSVQIVKELIDKTEAGEVFDVNTYAAERYIELGGAHPDRAADALSGDTDSTTDTTAATTTAAAG